MFTNFSACFRRFHRGRSFTKAEIALVETLERQRHRTAGVHAVINDPAGKFAPVLLAYLAYIQHLTPKDAIIVEPRITHHASPIMHRASCIVHRASCIHLTPRSYLRILGTRRPIGQILLLNAEKYCPSLPRHRSRLDAILGLALPYLNGPNTVVIIHGSTKTAKTTPFHRWLALAANPQSLYFLHPGPSAEAKPKPLRPKIIMHPKSCIMHHKSCIPKSLPALLSRRAPAKIPA